MVRTSRSRSWLLLFAGLLASTFGFSECPEQESVGTLSIPLTATSGGSTYRLSGSFTITGPVSQVVSADTPTVSVDLPAGSYSIALDSGWVLYRLTSGMWVPVVATLTSPNPTTFSIASSMTTNVAFRFVTNGTVVDIGQGTLNVTLEVTESSGMEGNALTCSNGIDDDADGLVDCSDSGCFTVPPCGGLDPFANVIDDFEDQNFQILPTDGRFGTWSTTTGAGAMLGMSFVPLGTFDSPFALEVQGNASSFGVNAVRVESLTPSGSFYDASAYAGIRFRIFSMASGPIRFGVGTPSTIPVSEGGTCMSGCSNLHGVTVFPSGGWQTVEARWGMLFQEGPTTPFLPSAIKRLEWRVPLGSSVLIRIDDVEFIEP